MATKKATKKRATKKPAVEQDSGETVGLKVSKQRFESGRNTEIGLVPYLPPDVPVFYVDNVNVLHTPSEFTISFMQAQPPLLKNAAAWNDVTSIPSKCVVRLIVSPMKMELIIKALAGNFQGYVQTYLQQEAGDGTVDAKADDNANAPES